MRLVNISKSGENYLIKASHYIKVLGIEIYSKVKTYKLTNNEKQWQRLGSSKKVSSRKTAKLNKWLKDHQKFIEKS